jgi:hypothetical protein
VPLNEDRGIYLSRSLDGGTSWITPTVILDAAAAKWDSVDIPRIALDPIGDTLHVVWLRKLPPGGIGDRQCTMRARPIKVKRGSSVLIKGMSIGRGSDGSLIRSVTWNEYDARRPDSAPRRRELSPTAGALDRSKQHTAKRSGPIGLAGDGNGHLYIAAIGESGGEESTLFNVEWNGQDWEERPALGLQRQATAGNSAVVALAPNQGKMAVLLRHRFWNEDGSTQQGVDATEREVAAAPLVAVPTFTPQPTPTMQPGPTPAYTTPRPRFNSATQSRMAWPGLTPLYLGGARSDVVVAAVGESSGSSAVSKRTWQPIL